MQTEIHPAQFAVYCIGLMSYVHRIALETVRRASTAKYNIARISTLIHDKRWLRDTAVELDLRKLVIHDNGHEELG